MKRTVSIIVLCAILIALLTCTSNQLAADPCRIAIKAAVCNEVAAPAGLPWQGRDCLHSVLLRRGGDGYRDVFMRMINTLPLARGRLA